MKGAIKIFRFKGISLFLHWTFSLLIAYVIYLGWKDNSTVADIAAQIGFVLAVFACVALHEYGHALAAAHYGIRTLNIVMLPIGGIANIERIPENPRQELVVAAAGPLVNVILAILLSIVQLIIYGWNFSFNQNLFQGNSYVMNLITVNISLLLFNLIPAFPMDGGRILRAILSFKIPRSKATKIASIVGQGFAVIFIYLGYNGNPGLLLIGIFVFMSARNANQ
jgi:Zn-dependent protease